MPGAGGVDATFSTRPGGGGGLFPLRATIAAQHAGSTVRFSPSTADRTQRGSIQFMTCRGQRSSTASATQAVAFADVA